MIVKRIGVWSAAKISGLLYGGMGLIFGAIFGLFSLVGMGIATVAAGQSEGAGEAFFGMLFGAGAVLLMPLFYGFMGLVVGAITALIYNLVARLVGGLELQVEPGPDMPPPVVSSS